MAAGRRTEAAAGSAPDAAARGRALDVFGAVGRVMARGGWAGRHGRGRAQDAGLPRRAAWNHFFSIALHASSPGGAQDGAQDRDADGARALAATLASLAAQTHRNIEVLVLGDAAGFLGAVGDPGGLRGLAALEEFRGLAPLEELRGLTALEATHPADLLCDRASGALWRGDKLIIAPAGTIFAPSAIGAFNAAFSGGPGEEPALVTCDHGWVLDAAAVEVDFLPGWDPDLYSARDYLMASLALSRGLVEARQAAAPVGDLEGWLAALASGSGQPASRHVAETLLTYPAAWRQKARAPRPRPARKLAGGTFPVVSIVIPNRNRPELLKACLGFLEFEIGFKPDIVIVDNASDDTEVLATYDRLKNERGARVVAMNQPFNFARMVNLGVSASRGEVVLLLNNDVEFTRPGQIERLVEAAQRPEVGVAGGTLLYPDGHIQHAGMVLTRSDGGGAAAHHILRGTSLDDPRYRPFHDTARNYQVVTGAVQAIRRDVFTLVGGYDEVWLPVEYNDVDFCLRVRQAGLRVVNLPLEGVIHHESMSRGSHADPRSGQLRAAAVDVVVARWATAFEVDPFHNPRADLPLDDPRGAETRSHGQFSARQLRRLWRHPAGGLALRRFGSGAAPDGLEAAARQNAVAVLELPRRLASGLTVAGPLCASSVVGAAARRFAEACDEARLPVSFIEMSTGAGAGAGEVASGDGYGAFASKINPGSPHRASLVVAHLSGLGADLAKLPAGRVNIAYPHWGVQGVPEDFIAAARGFDAIWAPSQFIAAALTGAGAGKVRLVPQPIRFPASPPAARTGRQSLDILARVDLDASFARQNPLAAVAAFRAAFGQGRRDARLVLEVSGRRNGDGRKALARAAARDRRISLVDRGAGSSRPEDDLAGYDAALCLHRSQGIGLEAAAALAAARAVVATDFGGTTEFIDAASGYPVAFRLKDIAAGEYPIASGQVWAEPDMDAAVAALRAIYDDPAEAEARARRGFARLKARQSLQAAGGAIAAGLGDLGLL